MSGTSTMTSVASIWSAPNFSLLRATAPTWTPPAVLQRPVIMPKAAPASRSAIRYTMNELLKIRDTLPQGYVPSKLNTDIVNDTLPSSSLPAKSLPSTPPKPVVRKPVQQTATSRPLPPLPHGTYTVESSILDAIGIPKGLVLIAEDGKRYTRNFDDSLWTAQEWQRDAQGQLCPAVMLYYAYETRNIRMLVRSQLVNRWDPRGPTCYYIDSEHLIRSPGEPYPEYDFSELPLGNYTGDQLYLLRDVYPGDPHTLYLALRNPGEAGRVFTVPLASDVFLGASGNGKHPFSVLASKGIKRCTLRVHHQTERNAGRANRRKVLSLF